MSDYRTLDDLGDLNGKRVLVRVDFNVPMSNGEVSDATRIERAAPSIRELTGKGARVILLSHMGRPKGQVKPEFSLEQILPALRKELGNVRFATDCVGEDAADAVAALEDGQIILLENLRFHDGEEKNDRDFAKALAANGDIYVNDAFSAAHRAHASTEGIARLLPAYAGRTMADELAALSKALEAPTRPVMAFVGGAKVSTKIDLLSNLITKVDCLVIGGGMANTFLAAQGISVGKSLCEHELTGLAKSISEKAVESGCELILPTDAVVAIEFARDVPTRTVSVDDVDNDEMILDLGPESIAAIKGRLGDMATVVWNGPLGAFEVPPFDKATVAAAQEAARLSKTGQIVSVAGGGDTVAALNHAGVAQDFTYISTAGGAFLEWLEGKDLPGVQALQSR